MKGGRGGGFLKCLHFSTRGEGGSRKYLHRHLTNLFFTKVMILKKKFIALQMNIFFPREIFFFQFFPIHFIFAAAIKTFFCLARGEGPSNVYVVFMGGLPNVYVYLQGGRGGQKWLKSCLRSKSMPPFFNFSVVFFLMDCCSKNF